MKYRPEIDGLRACAVLPVIFFHAGWTAFRGGFVGVDVFFVISGYLITSIILSQLEEGRFSLAGFYERRARRILPALYLVIGACFPLAWAWLPPVPMTGFADSVLAVTGFSSNFLFWTETNYFAAPADQKPLLHTWSLGVEEQFYVLFPLLLLAAYRRGKGGITAALAVLAALSLGLSIWATGYRPVAAFFLLPTRGWELLVGAALAVGARETSVRLPYEGPRRWLAQAASALGLAMIAFAIISFDETTAFPGVAALLPTIGAALIIVFASPGTGVGVLLRQKALVGLGVISYSAYLWHHPLFALARHRSLTEPGAVAIAVLILLTLVLATLSWRFVERPFRGPGIARTSVVRGAVIATGLFVGLGLYGHATEGHGVGRHETATVVRVIEKRLGFNHGIAPVCDQLFTIDRACRTSEMPDVLVWGDSYAMHLVQGLAASAPQPRIMQLTAAMCGPVLGLAPITQQFPEGWARDCIRRNDQVREWLRTPNAPKLAVLSSRLEQYVGSNARVLLRDGRIVNDDQFVFSHLLETLRVLRQSGVVPVVFAPPPSMRHDVGQCLVKARWFEQGFDRCDFDLEDADQKQRNVLSLLRRIEATGTRVVSMSAALCPGGRCRAAVGNTLVYRDGGHLSQEGSALIGRAMDFYGLVTTAR